MTENWSQSKVSGVSCQGTFQSRIQILLPSQTLCREPCRNLGRLPEFSSGQNGLLDKVYDQAYHQGSQNRLVCFQQS